MVGWIVGHVSHEFLLLVMILVGLFSLKALVWKVHVLDFFLVFFWGGDDLIVI